MLHPSIFGLLNSPKSADAILFWLLLCPEKEKRTEMFLPITSTPAVQKLMIDFMADVLVTPYEYVP